MAEQIRQGDIPGVQLRLRQSLSATPQVVWSWLTETARQRRWLSHEVDRELGSERILWSIDTPEGDSFRERLTVVQTEPDVRWVLDLEDADGGWPVPTRLTFEISPVRDGAELSVLQTGFAHLPLSDCLTLWESYRRRWRSAFGTLADLIQDPDR